MKERNFYDAIGFGALNVDRLGSVPQVLRNGETIVEKETRASGGSAANTIAALAELGLRTAYIGAVGEDQEGRILLSDFEKRGVDTSLIAKKDGSSGAVLGLTDSLGNRALYIFPGVNSELSDLDLPQPEQFSTRVFHLSSFVNQERLNYQQLDCQIKLASQMDPETKVSLVPGVIYAVLGISRLKPLLANCHYIFLAREELSILFGSGYLNEAKRLLNHKTEAVVVTAGAEGAYLLTKETQEQLPAFPVELVDATGAGDIFAAGFLHGQLTGLDGRSSVIEGNLLASYYVQEMGAREGFPPRQEFNERLREAIYENS